MGSDYSVFWASNREFAKSANLTGLSSPGAYPIDMLAFGLGDGSCQPGRQEKCRDFVLDCKILPIIKIWWPGRDLNPAASLFRAALSQWSVCFASTDENGGSDGTRTRGLPRDRQVRRR
jgi:hypothetical protein